MAVFILMTSVKYEGDTLRGVYSSLFAAKGNWTKERMREVYADSASIIKADINEAISLTKPNVVAVMCHGSDWMDVP